MAKISLSLLFNGNCEEAFNFYKSAFGTEFTFIGRYGDIPPQDGMPAIPESEKGKIENICLPVNEDTFLIGADVTGYMAQETVFGNNFSIYIEAANKEEADRLFAGLSVEGQVMMPMSVAHWGDYFGMFTDKFGVNWLINCARQHMG